MVHQAVEDRVPESGIVDHVVPVLDGQLAGDERGATAGAIFDEFEQIAAFAVAGGREPSVVEDEQIGLGERLPDLAVRAVRAGVHELFT